MSKNLYLLSICGFVALGIVFAALMARVTLNWRPANDLVLLVFALGVVAVAFLGTWLFNRSNAPAVSLLGYGLVAGPFGLLLGPVVAEYTSASVVRVLAITAIMSLGLGVIGAVIPDSLESWGKWLLGGLIALLVGLFVVPIFGFLGINVGGAMTVLDWVGVALFSLLIIYDINRALRLPRTLDNAIDSAATVFLDMLNIFIRYLGQTGDSD